MDIGLLDSLIAIAAGLTAAGAGGSAREEAASRRPTSESALDRAKSRVLVNLLNELRAPLMMIKAPLESGSGIDPMAADSVLDHADELQQGLERAVEIIQMDAGGRSAEAARTEVVDAVSYFVSSVRPDIERSGMRVGFESGVRRAVVLAPWPRVELLLGNLTEYALRGLEEGGALTISVGAGDAGTAVLELRSDGKLDPIDTSTAGVEEVGDPLVLALLLGRRRLVGLDGSMEFDKDGDQAVCRITLPAVEIQLLEASADAAPAEEGEREGEAEPDEVGGGTSVLVVDDHVGTRAYLRFALRRHHRILEASDGKEAFEIVRREKPDLVISDIMMPVMDGNQLCRAIKTDEDLNHIPVFLVTANSLRTLKTESLESGADDFLVKPFDVKEAVMRINNEIEMRKKLRTRYSREVVIKPNDITVTSEDEALINRARETVEQNMDNADFSIQDLAWEMGLSSRQLQRRLRETLDQSPVEFVRSLRIQRAAQLLGGQYGNVSEVAYSVGFTSLSYFAKCFREEYGTSPSAYKEERNGD